MGIIVDIIEATEVTILALKAYEDIESAEEYINTYKSQLENMNSKYIDKSIDELDVICRELSQLKESLYEISTNMETFLESYVDQDESIKG